MDDSVIDIRNDYSPVFGVEPEFVAFRVPDKCYLIVAHPPHANTGFFQFQSGLMVIRRIIDIGDVGANVCRSLSATGHGGEDQANQKQPETNHKLYLYTHI